MIICKCGAQCQDNSKFCPKCGATLTPATFQQTNTNAIPQGNFQNATYTNVQGNFQNGTYTNQQGNFQNGPYTNQPGGFQNGMSMMGQKPISSKKNPNIIGIVAGTLLVISMFLPYVTASVMGISFSQSLIKGGGDAYLFLVLGIAGVVLSILGIDLGTLVAGGIASLLSIYEIVTFSKELGKASSSYINVSEYIHRGVGFYVMIIASIALVLAMPIQKAIKKNK